MPPLQSAAINTEELISSQDSAEKKAWLVQLTTATIPEDVLEIASLGKNFGVSYTKSTIPMAQIITSIESYISTIDKDTGNSIRATCVRVIKNYMTSKQSEKNHDMLKKIRTTIQFKKSHPDILFLKADKGNITVVLDKNLYTSKMSELLNDESTYQIINFNPTTALQWCVSETLKKWHDKLWISEKKKFYLTPKNSHIARAYGLAKIHKENIPFRLIVSFIGTPTYKLAQYLQKILLQSLNANVMLGRKRTVENSAALLNSIRRLQLPKDFIMISMDVVSLFTNVPLQLVIAGIVKRWEVIKQHTKISKDEFIQAIRVCYNSSAFLFNDVIYQQVFGAAMGSPLSPIVAEIVMNDLENYCLAKLDFPVYLYTRYVDDILVFLPANCVENIVNVFNSYQKRLQFTVEVETQGKINFLELTLIRRLDKIEFDWYRKPTASGRYLNYYSHHSQSHKRAVIRNLVDKAMLLSDPRFRQKNLEFIKNSLQLNGYPVNFVKWTIGHRIPYLFTREYCHVNNNNFVYKNPGQLPLQKKFLRLPYIQKLTELLQRNLRKFGVNLISSNSNNLTQLFSGHKDPLKISEIFGIVCCIFCSNCDFVFVDHTCKKFNTYLSLLRFSLRYPYLSHLSTSLTEHALIYGHKFDFDNVKILEKEPSYKRRVLLTDIYTAKLSNSSKTDVNKIYLPLVKANLHVKLS